MYSVPDGKVLQYETFLNDTLKEDLRKLNVHREKYFEEISQYCQLKLVIENINKNQSSDKPLNAQIDLGCNFYAQAVVKDPSKVFVSVGFGFYVEFTHAEALRYISKKISFLEDQVKEVSNSMATAKAHIRMVMEALRELQIMTND